ncbi:MAG TPA: DUF4198 domain-containing protein [Chthoniobacterales bacterium]|nr:DUF4198 domain-containing protein [Chthoniobacterales bacterium]
MKKLTILVALLFAVSVPPLALAHDTWLIPDQFSLAPNSTVTLDMTSGMEFPKLDVGPKPERVKSATCRLAGKTFDITNKIAAPSSLQFKAELPDAGVATFWVKLPPRSIELKPEEVKEYLDEVDAPEALRKQWAEIKEPRWRESYTKHPKTFARVGEAPADRSWAEPAGMFLEIVPEKDPTALKAGDDFPVRVLKDGKPFAGFSLNAVGAGQPKGETRKTDSDGRVVFRVDAAGRWLLRGTDIRKSSRPDTDWESDFTTLTVEVKGK